MSPNPILQGKRILLRPIAPDDIDAYTRMLDDPESMRLTGTRGTFTREQTLGWIATIAEREGRVDLGIVVRETNELIGEVVLNEIDDDNRSANIRIGMQTAHANRGYGTEAMALLIAYAFEELKLHRVELNVYDFNPRALHVYEKLGFRQEGRRRDALSFDGAFYDSIEMGILEDEYRAWKAAQ